MAEGCGSYTEPLPALPDLPLGWGRAHCTSLTHHHREATKIAESCSESQMARTHSYRLPEEHSLSQAETPRSLPKAWPVGCESCQTLLGDRERLEGLSRDVYKRVSLSSARGTRKRKGFGKWNLRCLLRFSEDLAGLASARQTDAIINHPQ